MNNKLFILNYIKEDDQRIDINIHVTHEMDFKCYDILMSPVMESDFKLIISYER